MSKRSGQETRGDEAIKTIRRLFKLILRGKKACNINTVGRHGAAHPCACLLLRCQRKTETTQRFFRAVAIHVGCACDQFTHRVQIQAPLSNGLPRVAMFRSALPAAQAMTTSPFCNESVGNLAWRFPWLLGQISQRNIHCGHDFIDIVASTNQCRTQA